MRQEISIALSKSFAGVTQWGLQIVVGAVQIKDRREGYRRFLPAPFVLQRRCFFLEVHAQRELTEAAFIVVTASSQRTQTTLEFSHLQGRGRRAIV